MLSTKCAAALLGGEVQPLEPALPCGTEDVNSACRTHAPRISCRSQRRSAAARSSSLHCNSPFSSCQQPLPQAEQCIRLRGSPLAVCRGSSCWSSVKVALIATRPPAGARPSQCCAARLVSRRSRCAPSHLRVTTAWSRREARRRGGGHSRAARILPPAGGRISVVVSSPTPERSSGRGRWRPAGRERSELSVAEGGSGLPALAALSINGEAHSL